MLLLFERNVLCYHQVSSPQHQFVFSRVCGFCLDLEEVGAEAGEEKMGIEPEVERWKGKFEASFFLSVSPSGLMVGFIHQS